MEQRDPEQIPGDAQREAGTRPHARPSAVLPADGDDRDAVAAPPGEVDELDIEHDAGDLLTLEQIPAGSSPEPLEATLGVLDRADHPGRREEVEDPAEE